MNSFDVKFNYEVEEGVSLPVRVTGSRTKFYPAKTNCPNEDSRPAEGGELEDLKVFSGQRLPPALERMLLMDDEFLRRVEELI